MRLTMAGTPHKMNASARALLTSPARQSSRSLMTSALSAEGYRPRPQLHKRGPPPHRPLVARKGPSSFTGGRSSEGGIPGDVDRRQKKNDMMEDAVRKMRAEWKLQSAQFEKTWDRIATKIDVDVSKGLQATQQMRKENVFRPGDFILVCQSQGASMMGVIVPSPPDLAQGLSADSIYVLGVSGMVHKAKREDVLVHFPSMLDAKACARAGPASSAHVNGAETTFENSGSDIAQMVKQGAEPFDVERFRARAGLITVLRIFRQRVHQGTLLLQNAFSELFAAREFEASNVSSLTEPLATRRLSVIDAAKQMLHHLGHGADALVSRSLYTATHQLFFDSPEIYTIDEKTYRISQTYTARPMSDTAVIRQVRQWTRARNAAQGTQSAEDVHGEAVINGFVLRVLQAREWREKKAKDLVQQQAEIKLGEMRMFPIPGIKWTQEDKVVFRFLLLSLCYGRYLQADILTAPVMTILKKITGPLPFDLLPVSAPPLPRTIVHKHPNVPTAVTHASPPFYHKILRQVLEEAGFLSPWQSLVSSLHAFPPASQVVKDVREELERKQLPGESARTVLQPVDDLSARETHHETVYVIDDQGASELDDGISWQPVPESDDIWLHVHIADPTCYFEPGGALGTAVAQQSSTMYYPDRTFPLLPPELFERLPGLEQTEGQKYPQRAMTFSTRLTRDGIPIDYDIKLSLVTNVQTQLYDDVDALLGQPRSSLPRDQLKKWDELNTLRLYLYEVQKRRWMNHCLTNTPQPSPRVHSQDLLLPPDDAKGPTVFLGGPEVSISVPPAPTQEEKELGYFLEAASPSQWGVRDVVGECMLMAGRTAAKWGKDHQVPLPYNGMEGPEPQLFHEVLAQNPSRYGALTRIASLKLSTNTTYTAPHPVLHAGLGFDPLPFMEQDQSKPWPTGPPRAENIDKSDWRRTGYVRVTSPMRRYADMVAHWQIRHILLGKDKAQLHWSYSDMAELCPRLDESARYVKGLAKSSESFWAAYYLQPILHRGSPDPRLPKDSEAYQEQAKILTPMPAWVITDRVRLDPDMYANTRVHVRGVGAAAEARLPVDIMAHGSQGFADVPLNVAKELTSGQYTITELVNLYPNVPSIELGSSVQVQLVSAVCTGSNNYFFADIVQAAPP